MDEVDVANDYALAAVSFALAAARVRSSTKRPSLERCLNCDEEIPEARRLAQPGCSMCIECLTAAEAGRR